MYLLDEPSYIYLFIIIPIILVLYLWIVRWKSNTQKKFIGIKMINYLSPNRSKFKYFFKFFLLIFSLIFLIIALINPKMGTELETVKREGVDLVFAVDVSKSMLAEDVAPNRIEKAKRLVSEIINNLVGDRIGIIAYANQAIPQLPITTDYNAGKIFLRSLNTDMLSSQGTALNSALDLSSTYFNDNDQTNRVVFIFSDGEDHSEEAGSASIKAASEGIKIFTFGIGTESGSPIPIKINGVLESYKKDENNEVVITKRNSEILKEISENANGKYIDANNTKEVIEFVSEVLKNLEKKEFEAKNFVSYKDQFQPFIFAAFILLLMELFVFEKETVWLKKLNLFNEKK